jgi:shikimate kinase
MNNFIKKKFFVEESDLKSVYKLGKAKRGWKFDPKVHNVFFIGLRGSGKTTLGRLIAYELNMKFVDTDEEIVNSTGMHIEKFVEKYGWDKFREKESDILRDICKRKGQVCATGGGIVLKESNRELIKKSGFVFYLMGDVLTLEQRIIKDKKNKNRPPLTSLPLREELVQSLREREPYYLATSHFILRADKNLEELKKDVFVFLGIE